MARRLAHEIKNPLTPIQLAVQEIHRRYDGKDSEYGKILDTTLEIVQDEVGTLRRLVTEFSDFARLPRAELEPADLAEFLKVQSTRFAPAEDEQRENERESFLDLEPGASVLFDVPDIPAHVYLDRQMFRRALFNLIRNAVQAVEESAESRVQVRVSLERTGDHFDVHVDDNGPGIDAGLKAAVFDPYVTGKRDGTGLGLAIVKKIVVEHGGTVAATDGPLGGARVSIRLPAIGSKAATGLKGGRVASASNAGKGRASRPRQV
jgi:nitrogen fixation/metabolism regulation signal transduction histidine kinase